MSLDIKVVLVISVRKPGMCNSVGLALDLKDIDSPPENIKHAGHFSSLGNDGTFITFCGIRKKVEKVISNKSEVTCPECLMKY